MKHIALGLDFDGCILTIKYVFPFIPEKVGDIKANTSIVDINAELWAFIIELCEKNPDLEKLTLVHFSLRQNVFLDADNSKANGTESSFLAMIKIEAHVTKLLRTHAPNVKVKLHDLLMPDIYNRKEIGHTRRKALEDIDYSLTGMGIITPKQAHDYDLNDTSKVTFIFAHVHEINADAFYYLDDLMKIHRAIQQFYGSDIGSTLIPKDVKVISYWYDDGKLTHEPQCKITGTGSRCSRYGEILRTLEEKTNSFPIFDVANIKTYTFIEKFHQLHQIFQEPLTSLQHTASQAILIHSFAPSFLQPPGRVFDVVKQQNNHQKPSDHLPNFFYDEPTSFRMS